MPERDGLTEKARRRVHRKPSCSKLQRPICGAMSGGSKNGLYFQNQCVEGYTGIYIRRVRRFRKVEIFQELLIFRIKIITKNQELLFRLRKNISELRKILEKFLGIDGRMRNTTKVVLAPENTFGLIEEKGKAPRNRNLIPKKVGKIPRKKGIVLTHLKTFSKPLDFENKASYLTFVFCKFSNSF